MPAGSWAVSCSIRACVAAPGLSEPSNSAMGTKLPTQPEAVLPAACPIGWKLNSVSSWLSSFSDLMILDEDIVPSAAGQYDLAFFFHLADDLDNLRLGLFNIRQ